MLFYDTHVYMTRLHIQVRLLNLSELSKKKIQEFYHLKIAAVIRVLKKYASSTNYS